jgi:hypothetical protein
MTPFADSPRLLEAGLVLSDPARSAVLRGITIPYNPKIPRQWDSHAGLDG